MTKTYRQGCRVVTALSDVSLTIPAGQLVAIQGPTGGGKSTLLQLLGALEKPTKGSVSLGDDVISAMPDRAPGGPARRRRWGSCSRASTSSRRSPRRRTWRRRSRRSAFRAPSGGLGRPRRWTTSASAIGCSHRPAELSGGQQQRVAIARALVKQPDVLLADEPTGNLDEETRDEIMDLLEGLWRDKGLTLIVVTHDSAIAKRAERRLHIKQGKVTER